MESEIKLDVAKVNAYRANMKWKKRIIAAFILLILLSPVLFRKRSLQLVSNGSVVAVAKRSAVPPWNDGKVDVYVGNEKVFSLWADAFDLPLFIYPFADGQRFLCDHDYDTAILVFVVDFSDSGTNESNVSKWPADEMLRAALARMATNVVLETKGFVRLPSYAEVQEVSSFLANATLRQIKNDSFPYCDFGVYRNYVTKKELLLDLATNRQSYWPLGK